MTDEERAAERNRQNVEDYEVHFVSFKRTGTTAYNTLSLGKRERPEEWQTTLLREFLEELDTEDDLSDLC